LFAASGDADTLRVLFVAEDPAHGEELWSSDGTVSGTRHFSDFAPGPAGSHPQAMARAGTKVFFFADDGSHGSELCVLDVSAYGGGLAIAYGAGCRGSGATPALSCRDLPVLGSLGLRISARGAPGSSAVAWLIGARSAATSIGTCTLLVATPWYVVAGMTDPIGTATLPLPIPGDPAFVGLELRVQGAFAEGAGLALSDGMHVLIGAR